MCSLRTAGLSQPPMVTSFPTLQLGKTSWPLVSPMHLQHYSEGVAVRRGGWEPRAVLVPGHWGEGLEGI